MRNPVAKFLSSGVAGLKGQLHVLGCDRYCQIAFMEVVQITSPLAEKEGL